MIFLKGKHNFRNTGRRGKAKDNNRFPLCLQVYRLQPCRCYNCGMSRPKAVDEIDALLKRKEQLEKRLRAAQERQKERERLDNERRKLIIGAAVLDFILANQDSPLISNLREILDHHITRPADRALLPARPAPATAAGETARPSEPPTPDASAKPDGASE
jgi:hypothetical protein